MLSGANLVTSMVNLFWILLYYNVLLAFKTTCAVDILYHITTYVKLLLRRREMILAKGSFIGSVLPNT